MFRCLLAEVPGFMLWWKELEDPLSQGGIEVNREHARRRKPLANAENIQRDAVVFLVAIRRRRMTLTL